jgi:peptidoglycan lytic transglycosylase
LEKEKGVKMLRKALVLVALFFIVFLNPAYAGNNASYGMASWYSETDPGILKTTANMEIFDDQQLTCAIWGVPFNTLIKVTNLINGRSVIVRVNDRGPAKRLVAQGRIIDLSKAAFYEISSLDKGLVTIKMEILRQTASLPR